MWAAVACVFAWCLANVCLRDAVELCIRASACGLQIGQRLQGSGFVDIQASLVDGIELAGDAVPNSIVRVEQYVDDAAITARQHSCSGQTDGRRSKGTSNGALTGGSRGATVTSAQHKSHRNRPLGIARPRSRRSRSSKHCLARESAVAVRPNHTLVGL